MSTTSAIPRTMLIPALATGLALAAACAPADDWPQWRGPNRDGLSAETGWQAQWPDKGPPRLWKKNIGNGYSSVTVVGDRLYTMGNSEGMVKTSDNVWCLDAATGNEMWRYPYLCKPGSYHGPESTPTVDGDVLYTLSREGDLFCLGTKDGSVKWQVNVRKAYGVKDEPNNWGLACSPLVMGDKLVLDLGKVLVLDKATGKKVFALGDDAPGFSSPMLVETDAGKCVTSFNQFGLAVYDLATQKQTGRYEWKSKFLANTATPIVSAGKLFITSGYGRGCALFQLAPSGLQPVYENTNLASECIAPVLYKGHLYGVTGEQSKRGALKCLDFATGQVKWEKTGIRVGGGIMIADGKILHMIDGGVLLVAEAMPDAYREIAKAKVLDGYCWTMPVLANGRIYCRNAKGDLVCLDVAGK